MSNYVTGHPSSSTPARRDRAVRRLVDAAIAMSRPGVLPTLPTSSEESRPRTGIERDIRLLLNALPPMQPYDHIEDADDLPLTFDEIGFTLSSEQYAAGRPDLCLPDLPASVACLRSAAREDGDRMRHRARCAP